MDNEIPTFGDHQDPLLVTTRSRNAGASRPSREQDVPHTLTHEEYEGLDDTFDEGLDLFDLDLADAPHELLEVNIADVPTKLTIPEILESQRTDAFCLTVLSRQALKLDTLFYEDDDGSLRRQHPRQSDIKQIDMPESLRPRILKLAHYSRLTGHPDQTRMYQHVRRTYYWPHMAADIYATVRNCSTCVNNRLKLRKRTNPLKLFPATKPLTSLCTDILGTLQRTKNGYRLSLVITDRFTKLT